MGIRPFKVIPKNEREWARFFEGTQVKPSASSVTPTELAASTTDLIDATASTAADAAQTAAVASATTLATAAQSAAESTAASLASNAQATAIAQATITASASLAAHVGAADPHPVYLLQTEGDARYQPLAAVLSMLHTGTGSPEGVLTATVGHIYLRTDGGASTTMYCKESGSGNTGWIPK